MGEDRRFGLARMASAGLAALAVVFCGLPGAAGAADAPSAAAAADRPLCEYLGTCAAPGGDAVSSSGGAPASCSPGAAGSPGGGADEAVSACEAADDPASLPPPADASLGVGNPVNVASGNKYQRETDLAALPGELGLQIVRHYNSASREVGWIGRNWRLGYDSRLFVRGAAIQIVQADGRRLDFDRDPAHPGVCASANPELGRVTTEGEGARTRHRWRWPDGRELWFDAAGWLVAVQAPSGARLLVWRGPHGEPLRVRDPQGRELEFVYDRRDSGGWGGIRAIKSPVGTFTYEHGTRGALAGTLRGVSEPGERAGRRYHYASEPGEAGAQGNTGAHLLAGISRWHVDAQGQRHTQRLSRYRYDARGRAVLSQRLDGQGQVSAGVRIEYLRGGLASVGLSRVTDEQGRTTLFRHGVFGGEHRLLAVQGQGCTGCRAPGVAFAWTAQGQLAARLAQHPGQPGVLTRYERDPLGRVVAVWQHDVAARASAAERLRPGPGRWRVRLAYDGDAPRPARLAWPSVVAGREHSVTISRDARGQPTAIVERGWRPAVGPSPAQPIERHTTLAWREDANGVSRLEAVDGPLPGDADTVRLEHDAHGRLVRVRLPEGLQQRVAYDAAGRVAQLVAPDGGVLRFGRDASGRLARWQRGALVLELQRDALGRPLLWQRNDGLRLAVERDETGRIRALVDGEGLRREIERDAQGQVVRLHWRDAGGRELREPQPLQRDAQAAVQQAGDGRVGPGSSLVAFTDALGRTRRLRFDARGRPVAFEQLIPAALRRVGWTTGSTPTDAEGEGLIATRLLYDDDSDVPTGVVAPNGATTTRQFDDFGRVVATHSPDRGTSLAWYDEADRLVALRDAAGRRTTWRRDALGRPLFSVSRAPGAAIEAVAWRYRGARLAGVANRHQADGYAYDAQGRLAVHTTWLATPEGRWLRFDARYTWDAFGRLRDKRLPDGLVLQAGYDAQGRLQQWTLRTPDGQVRPLATLRHDSLSGLRAVSFGNGVTTRLAHDDQGRLAAIATADRAGTALYTQRNAFDTAGRIQAIERQGRPEHYRHDALDRLIEADTPQARERWRYDLGGNRLVWAVQPKPAGPQRSGSARYEQGSHRLVSLQARQGPVPAAVRRSPSSSLASGWQYDPSGNPLRLVRQGAVREHVYGADGRLQAVRQPTDRGPRELAAYRYDAAGQRVRKHTAQGTTYFLYANQQLVAEADGHGRITAHYLYWRHRPLAKIETRTGEAAPNTVGWQDVRPSAWQRFVQGLRRLAEPEPPDDPSATPPATAVRVLALHTDHLGAPQLATDAQARVVWSATYRPFGAATVDEDPDHDGHPTRIDLRLPGQFFDAETGTHYNLLRDYDPQLGRYLQSDPIGIEGGFNTYGYVGASPLGAIDPLGLWADPADDSPKSDKVSSPQLFGAVVHALFSTLVRSKGIEWYADVFKWTEYFGGRPDAIYHATSSMSYVWELKPYSYQVGKSKYSAAAKQLSGYIESANRNIFAIIPRVWERGDASVVMDGLPSLIGHVWWFGEWYDINLYADEARSDSGLLFYTQQRSACERSLEDLGDAAIKYGSGWFILAGIARLLVIP